MAITTATTGATTATMPGWATGETHRVDPRATDVPSFAMDGASYRVDARGAVVTRGTVARLLPVRAFQGVAARAIEAEDGTVTVTLELMHADAALSVPVLVARDLYDVAADWRAWAGRTGLPMLMVEGDGSVEVLDATPRPGADTAHEGLRSAVRPSVRVRSDELGVSLRLGGREAIRTA